MNQVEAVRVGERQVDDHCIVHTFHGVPLGFSAGGAGVEPEASLSDCPDEKFANCRVVFDYKQPQVKLVSLFLDSDGAASEFQRMCTTSSKEMRERANASRLSPVTFTGGPGLMRPSAVRNVLHGTRCSRHSFQAG
jgi:hypothetical protein